MRDKDRDRDRDRETEGKQEQRAIENYIPPAVPKDFYVETSTYLILD